MRAARAAMQDPRLPSGNTAAFRAVSDVASVGMQDTTSDALLVHRMACGDAPALGLLHDRWADLLYDRAVRMALNSVEAEALVENAFWQAWLQADRYATDCGRPDEWLLNLMSNLNSDRLSFPF
jgi:hypothetical protein